jgi:hypothetical protein
MERTMRKRAEMVPGLSLGGGTSIDIDTIYATMEKRLAN